MLTVPEAARRIGRHPETVRRWIREGKLRSRKVGTQHVLDEKDVRAVRRSGAETLAVPRSWTRTATGRPMPDFVAILRRQRREH
ncbi:MAG: helix-turn-helix domain-containing protein [Candidatus Limnocylindria bacterium]